MPALAQDTGIVIHRVRHGETSLILTAFTRESGKLGLMAKGARAKAKTGGTAGLELFAEAQFVYYRKAGRDLQLLKEWSTIEPNGGLRQDFDCLTVASAVAELLSRCFKDEDPHPDIYDAAIATLHVLNQHPSSPLPVLFAFEMSLFSSLGFALQLETDAESHRPLQPPYEGDVKYRLADGAFIRPETKGQFGFDGKLSPESFSALARLSTARPELAARVQLGPRARYELAGYMARFLETHLPVRGKLRSLAALHWADVPPDFPTP
jgi:DNA repair protein RecO (recombination protein O)